MSEAQNMDKMELLFDDLEKPEAIVEAQYSSEATSEENKGQSHFARVGLFFSFDIVNSTMYKTMTGNWPVVIRGLLEDIRARVFKMQDLSSCNLWRVIGDEMVFVMMIDTKEELGLAVESIFEVTQKVSKLLKTGKFFETLEGQTIQRQDLELLKIQTPLSVKSAAWIAIINEKIESPYECIKFNYSASPQNQIITEYLGRDIDAGFRLKGYTQDRRLVVSFELAYILECLGKKKELYIMDYPVAVKTIVTIDMAERIAAKYGVKTINVLTGFKFIGEQIGFLEKQGEEDSYIFGMEESYGYLSGSYVRDKDGVNAAFLICEMFTYYASQGIGLFEKLNELYAEYGYCLNTLHSYTFEGSAGFEKMQNIMVSFRKSITEFAGKKVLKCFDYSEGIDGLPKSDVLKFFLEDNCSIVVRPSGTEPKLKAYISVSATTKEEAQVVEGKLARAVEEKM